VTASPWGDPKPSGRNDAVRRALAQHGDDGTRVRHVIHFAYPAVTPTGVAAVSRAQAERVAQDIVPDLGFTHRPDATGPNAAGIVFEQYREVASAAFDALTDRREDAMAAVGWTYDGWECAVETGDDAGDDVTSRGAVP
jgi:hypothetical protein